MKQVLVLGCESQLGNELKLLLSNKDSLNSFIFINRKECDITDSNSLNKLFEKYQFEYCINTSAYTAVDKAETEVEAAFAVNSKAIENLAAICKQTETQLIHISTDFVFDGKKNTPYTEEDITNPLCVYGKSKRKGEEKLLKIYPSAIIIRTSWLYSNYGNNFVKTVLRLVENNNPLRIVFDQVGTPTYAADLASVIIEIINQEADLNGIYHYSNEGVASWYDFAKAIIEIKGIEKKVFPISTKDFPTPAIRPPYSVLDKRKIKEALNIEIPYWRDSLNLCLDNFD